MSEVSNEIYRIVNEEAYADPFNKEFDAAKLKKEFGDALNEDEEALLAFLNICNGLQKQVKERVFTLFNVLGLEPKDLVNYFFILANRIFLEIHPEIFNKVTEGLSIDTAKMANAQYVDESGKEVHAKSKLEVWGDVIGMIISLSAEWSDERIEFKSHLSIDEIHQNEALFNEIASYASLLLVIKNSIYNVVKYEQGKVVFRNKEEVKIENGLQGIRVLISASEIRNGYIIQDYFLKLVKQSEIPLKKEGTFEDFHISDNVLTPFKGEVDIVTVLRSNASLFAFYPHFIGVKLEYFDGLTIEQLIDLYVIIEECINKLNSKINKKTTYKTLQDIPVKFNEKEIIEFISTKTHHKVETVKKYIDSLTADIIHPYFWREPFYRVGDFIYFTLASIGAPNLSLYFDKWTNISGYTIESKERMYTEFILEELTAKDFSSFEFNILDLNELHLDSEHFYNSVLIETSSLYILLEVRLYDFPIESNEIQLALGYINKATFKVKEKADKVKEVLGGKKELIKMIITNYTHFSGLQMNDISIVDYSLFRHYIVSGEFIRASYTFLEGEPLITIQGTIPYYSNEEEFNKYFSKFFMSPIPISYIKHEFILSEKQITPEIVSPRFILDTINRITDEQLMHSYMELVANSLNHEYFGEPKDEGTKNALDQSILYSLSEIFTKLAYYPYSSYKERTELYRSFSKTKIVGISQLTYCLLKSIEKLNGKRIKKTKHFENVEYEIQEAVDLIKRSKILSSGVQRLSEFKIDDNTFTREEEKKIISYSLDVLSSLSYNSFSEESLETALIPVSLLYALIPRHDIEYEFFTACGKIVDGLNYIHKYQAANNFCEEILIISVSINKHYQGWNLLFKCYTTQQNIFDASINGCLFIAALSVQSEIPDYLAFDSQYGALKYFRNFGFVELATHIYENLRYFQLSAFDTQRFTLSYFYTFIKGEFTDNISILDQILEYLEKEIDNIIAFGSGAVGPWLAMLYQIERAKALKIITYENDFKKYIDKFEANIDRATIDSIKGSTIGNGENIKVQFISAILNAFETVSSIDFINESQRLRLMASNLFQYSIKNNDIDGILLTGLINNDQSFTFSNTSVEQGTIAPLSKPLNTELLSRLNEYQNYILNRVNLLPNQLLVWLVEDLKKVYSVSINNKKEVTIKELIGWDLDKMVEFTDELEKFYFNAKKDSDDKPICIYSNPKAVRDYDELVQKEDYSQLIKALSFSNLSIEDNIDELFICFGIDISSFPPNLLEVNNEFISSLKPVCNVISLERFIENHNSVYLNKSYTISAWIPTEDEEFVINMGYGLLQSTLEKYNAKIYTTSYPSMVINTDLNIFLAHGIKDSSGFKAVYTNLAEMRGIESPFGVFGKGKIAILFICNSGSSNHTFFSNSIVSFSGELLKSGYESVIAPFWPFDVTMSKIWLEEFLNVLNQGLSINYAVWFANNKLSEFNGETSSIYCAPTGCLAMHLYGNPNVFVNI